MIFVDRNDFLCLTDLKSDGVRLELERMHNLLTVASNEHLRQLRIGFQEGLLDGVVSSVQSLFNGKCAFCEVAGNRNRLHHFRPGKLLDGPRDALSHLYYAWLYYDWDNLLFVCEDCIAIRSFQFPVAKRRAKLLASVDECRVVEKPLFLDPCFDDPSIHMVCLLSGELHPLTQRGADFIHAMKLNYRDSLVKGRAAAWPFMDQALDIFLTIDFRNESSRRDLEESLLKLLTGPYQHLAARRAAFSVRMHQFEEKGFAIPDSVRALGVERMRDALTKPLNSFAIRQEMRGSVPSKYGGKRQLPPLAFRGIEGIEIRNFKGIETLSVTVPHTVGGDGRRPSALVLLGENSTGKSSLLEAVALALLGTDSAGLRLAHTEFLHQQQWAVRRAEEPGPTEVSLHMGAGNHVSMVIDREGRFVGLNERAAVVLAYGPRRFHAKASGKRRLRAPWQRVRSLFDPEVPLSNPSEWLLSCSDEHFSLAVRALRSLLLIPEEALVIRGTREGESKRSVHFEVDGRGESLETFSHGYKTVLAMGVDIIRELLDYWPDLEQARGIVLIDELDVHLHPRWKMQIAQRLREAFPGVQFICSTHDPLCLRGFRNGEVVVLRREGIADIVTVDELPNVQGLSVQQLLTSEYFGLFSTEDPALDEKVARYATLASKRDRTNSEDQEMARLRQSTTDELVLGASPDERIVLEATAEYLLQQRGRTKEDVAGLKRDAVEKVLNIWRSSDADGLPS